MNLELCLLIPKYYVIEPEVAGGFGENCEIDWSTGKMQVNKLHYQFDGWLGDELLESTPCYIAKRAGLCEMGATGLVNPSLTVCA